ncbi:MAG: hypothetical protein JWM37_164 [Candidatus Saccharibacteria bacterium]|nr:hypothetical protein [Candidatus Saccharibacteria bacterium]
MDSQKQQLIERLQGATNILVTVSNNPTVDQLAACIGMTLMLNEAGKRATAVYSGETPSTIEFLQPAATIEKNTDSLRDFIISLDMSKADKLRYKKEDQVVKIFITPYRTSLSDHDLIFSQGDFNIDVVVALGVKSQEDLDQAITAHGRILHDAAVVSINNTPDGNLGSVNWQDLSASSLSEQVASLAASFENLKLDEQTATALLTGIVAETNRFSNAKTSAATMGIAANLMSAGANQQLVASELDKPEPQSEPEDTPETPQAEEDNREDNDAGSPADENADPTAMIFDHEDEPEPAAEAPVDDNQIHIDESGNFSAFTAAPKRERLPDVEPGITQSGNNMIMQPPANNPMFTANSVAEDEMFGQSTDPLAAPAPARDALLSHDTEVVSSQPPTVPLPAPAETVTPAPPAPEPTPAPAPEPQPTPQPAPALEQVPALISLPEPAPALAPGASSEAKTLADIEAEVHAKEEAARPDEDNARDAVNEAIASSPNQPLEPIAALNAQPLAELSPEPATEAPLVAETVAEQVSNQPTPAPGAMDMPLPTIAPPLPTTMPPASSQSSPPPGPPPMLPPFPQR